MCITGPSHPLADEIQKILTPKSWLHTAIHSMLICVEGGFANVAAKSVPHHHHPDAHSIHVPKSQLIILTPHPHIDPISASVYI